MMPIRQNTHFCGKLATLWMLWLVRGHGLIISDASPPSPCTCLDSDEDNYGGDHWKTFKWSIMTSHQLNDNNEPLHNNIINFIIVFVAIDISVIISTLKLTSATITLNWRPANTMIIIGFDWFQCFSGQQGLVEKLRVEMLYWECNLKLCVRQFFRETPIMSGII